MAVCVWMFMYSATPCSHSSRVITSQVTCSTWLNHVWWNYWHVEYTVYNREIWLMRLLSACLHLSLLIRAGLICRIFNIDTSSKIQRNVVTNVDTTSWILLMFVSLCLVGVWKDASFFFCFAGGACSPMRRMVSVWTRRSGEGKASRWQSQPSLRTDHCQRQTSDLSGHIIVFVMPRGGTLQSSSLVSSSLEYAPKRNMI